MSWVLTIVGFGLVVIAVRDIFHTLWHPGGFGELSHLVFATTWRVSRLTHRGSRPSVLAGPLGLLATIAWWAALIVAGFAMIYLPRMPGGFHFGSSLDPAASSDLIASLYLSVVALTTLGLGDIQPATPLLRLAVPVEALLGFLLLTAGISWILQLYPALIRRRALARRLTTMARHSTAELVRTGDVSVAVQHLESVRSDLAGVEMDLVQYAESYYFLDVSADLSIAAALPYVAAMADAGAESSHPEVRQAAAMLKSGLGAVLAELRSGFLPDDLDDARTLDAFAHDHRQPRLLR